MITKMLLRTTSTACYASWIYKQWLLPSAILGRQIRTSIVPMAIRLFEGEKHAELYAKYRPTYPDAMFEELHRYCISYGKYGLSLNIAVDVGCGSGQSTRPLCRYFRQVIGSDVSERQVASAIAQTSGTVSDKLHFRTSAGEDLKFLKDCSVDLITIAQALHWLNLDVFYSEVRRVLKPNGVFAAYGYGCNVIDVPEADKLQSEFYSVFLREHWNKERRHIETHFADLTFPFEPITRIESEGISIRCQMPLSAYIGYLSTWSAWVKYKQIHPESEELHNLHEKLHKIYFTTSGLEDPLVSVYWPGFLILCRKPA